MLEKLVNFTKEGKTFGSYFANRRSCIQSIDGESERTLITTLLFTSTSITVDTTKTPTSVMVVHTVRQNIRWRKERSPRDEALLRYCQWHRDQVKSPTWKRGFVHTYRVTKEACLDLKHVYKAQDMEFYTEKGVKLGIAKSSFGDVYLWAKGIDAVGRRDLYLGAIRVPAT